LCTFAHPAVATKKLFQPCADIGRTSKMGFAQYLSSIAVLNIFVFVHGIIPDEKCVLK